MRTAKQHRVPLKQVVEGLLVLSVQVQQDAELLAGHEAEAKQLIEAEVTKQGWSLADVAQALDEQHVPQAWRWETGIDLLIGNVH